MHPASPLTPASERLGRCVVRAGRGDHKAMAKVYDATSGEVHRLALVMTGGDEARASRVLRRTYAAVWADAASFDATQRSARAWVLGLAWAAGHAADEPEVA